MSRSVTAPDKAREYETIYILRPDVDADLADRLGTRLVEVIGREKGQLVRVEAWGRRRLAYDIRKHRRGVYIYLKYLGNGKTVSEIERSLRLTDGVLKYQTVLVRNDVEVASVTIVEEDVKFERLELPPLEDDVESRERQLGLIEPERRHDRRHDISDDDPDLDGDEDMRADDEEV